MTFPVGRPGSARRADLLRGEGGAQRADGLGVLRRLLLDLQQLSGLDDGLQGGCSFTLVQVVPSQPLLHLTGVVPAHTHTHTHVMYMKTMHDVSKARWQQRT